MKIALSEIWNFSELIEKDEKGWEYLLVAGDCVVKGITHDELLALKNDPEYDTELLPSIFTFREVLWQPDVYTEASMSLPGLRILQAFCEEVVEKFNNQPESVSRIYASLLQGLADCCKSTAEEIEKEKTHANSILGSFRTKAFPILKFFIYHPQNRHDYHRDAINRLNYAVKVMLTEFHGRYSQLQDPYWEVKYSNGKSKSTDTSKKGVEEK